MICSRYTTKRVVEVYSNWFSPTQSTSMSSRSIDGGGGHNRSRIGRPLEDDDCSSKKAFRPFFVVVVGKNRPVSAVCLVPSLPLSIANSGLNRHFIVRKLRERRGASRRQKYERGEREADEENSRLAHSTHRRRALIGDRGKEHLELHLPIIFSYACLANLSRKCNTSFKRQA